MTFIFSVLLWPDLDLDLLKNGLRSHAVFFLCIQRHFEFELFAARLTDLRTQNIKTPYLPLAWLDLTSNIDLKMLRMD